jgi:hypothetical protein
MSDYGRNQCPARKHEEGPYGKKSWRCQLDAGHEGRHDAGKGNRTWLNEDEETPKSNRPLSIQGESNVDIRVSVVLTLPTPMRQVTEVMQMALDLDEEAFVDANCHLDGSGGEQIVIVLPTVSAKLMENADG